MRVKEEFSFSKASEHLIKVIYYCVEGIAATKDVCRLCDVLGAHTCGCEHRLRDFPAHSHVTGEYKIFILSFLLLRYEIL